MAPSPCLPTSIPPCADGTLKLWDLRKLKTPVAQADDLYCNYSMTQVGKTFRQGRWCGGCGGWESGVK